ncbi:MULTISPECIES: FadR/GntR family transcriptional regulator [Gallibacterium]|uniref:GntR family transcriptional regulator n=1 Tax=Gallibacterium genomosp. 3 TaxID=505345 RepID=A0A1A7NVP8_9PAST|nr:MULTISPECIES: FadR/GntR family transcriptional regulator [Gallibacterium]MDA3979363.1 FadR/GntR family transcriptional regulator [Gallibacterium sp. AGMB14963]OBW93576.1 GntR family transcriptional regulator [Gallibacterium genomosp. 3]OBX03873.1 GntR family transcriptional regulator [Gallibacterium genomosp. 3]OBX07836.1 GntR family transcriptional regulator [Gallibacterium genomosp. 3]
MKKLAKKASNLALQEEIKQLILSRGLKAGDLMPTENELMTHLNVSRSSLREAVKSLEALHILDIHHGVGTFISESSLTPMIQSLAFHTQLHLQDNMKYLLDILDVREILQYGFAPLAIAKISDQEVDALQELSLQMKQRARDGEYSTEIEYQIHLQTYQAIKNPLLSQYLDAFWQIFQLQEDNLPASSLTPEQIALSYQEWVDAVEARDINRFQHSVLLYFRHLRQRINP